MECHRTKINDVDFYVITLKDMPNMLFILLNKKKSFNIYIMIPFVFKQPPQTGWFLSIYTYM